MWRGKKGSAMVEAVVEDHCGAERGSGKHLFPRGGRQRGAKRRALENRGFPRMPQWSKR